MHGPLHQVLVGLPHPVHRRCGPRGVLGVSNVPSLSRSRDIY